MKKKLLPVSCPVCGENQNSIPGEFNPDDEPFGPVTCVVCDHQFSREEYLARLEVRRQAFTRLTGPSRN